MNRAAAEEIVDTVISNLKGRSGIGDEFDMIDPETYSEMIEDCITDVQRLKVW